MVPNLSYDKKVFLYQLLLVIISLPVGVIGGIVVLIGIFPATHIEPTLMYRVTAFGVGALLISLSIGIALFLKKIITKHKGNVARFADDLAGMSVSLLLSNQATFHVKVKPGGGGEIFAFQSPEYQTHLVIYDGVVEFRRNGYIARKKIGPVQRHFQILLSWMPDRFQLALMVDDDVGGEDACVTIETESLYIPISLLKWARNSSYISREAYDSPSEFLSVLLENIRQANQRIKDVNSFSLFWDRQIQENAPNYRIPKREPESMLGVAAFLQDRSIISGYELIQESAAGAGKLDLRALATLKSGGFINICIEGKNAHSDDLKHGVTDQLPEYMRRVNADYGVYLVLWYKCDAFQEPKDSNIDVTLGLAKLKPMENIHVESFDLSLPKSPSNRKFEYK